VSIDATSTKLVSKDFGAFPLSEADFARSLKTGTRRSDEIVEECGDRNTNCTRRLHKVRGTKIQDKQFEEWWDYPGLKILSGFWKSTHSTSIWIS